MRALHWLTEELQAVLLASLYFGACFFLVLFLKHLILEDYGIAFWDLSSAVVLALVTAKVVVLLDRVSLKARGLVEVLVRTSLYTLTAFVLMVLEKAFEARGEAGGFLPALGSILEHRDMPRLWASLICVGVAFAGYAAFGVLRREIGAVRLQHAFLRHPERTS